MDSDRINQIINEHQGKPSSLIQVLMEIQEKNHWLPREVLEMVSEKLEVPLSQVLRIATFYKTFSLTPKGRHQIHVCTGTACQVRGARLVLDKVQDLTGIKAGETDPNSKFSLETVNCQGCCALGPVMGIDGKPHARMSPAEIADTLKKYD